MERRIGRTTVAVQQADITRLTVDAVVNAANTRLWMGGGVAGALKHAGGAVIEEEAMRAGPIRVGEAVATGAGRLPCRYVIHAATMGQDLATDGAAIEAATRSGLRVAEELGCASIAVPALGTGVGGYPLEEAARLIVEATAAHLRGGSPLDRIVLVAFNAEAAEAFAAALEEI
jgi:O-acetyl-ADP-ribose deacetylase (regulator of RNase III)